MIRCEWILALVALSFIRDSVASTNAILYANVTAGSTVILPCKQTSKTPGSRVIWLDPHGKPVAFGGRRFLLDDRFSVQRPSEHEWNLQIRSTRIRDSGEYKCLLSKPPAQEKVVSLNVRSRDMTTKPPTTTTTPAAEITTTAVNEVVKLSALVGGTVELPCLMDTEGGRYTVRWLSGLSPEPISLGNTIFISASRFGINRPSEKEWNLLIKSISPDDSGLYTCEMNSDPVTRKVVGLDVEASDNVTDTSNSKTVYVPLGGSLRLACATNGIGQDWFFEGKKITFSGQWYDKLQYKNETYSEVVIEVVDWSESGTYVCRSKDLEVYGYNVQISNDTSNSKTVYVALGGSLHLTCNTSGVGQYWFFEGRKITTSPPWYDKLQLRTAQFEKETYSEVSIEEVDWSDSGTYVCRSRDMEVYSYNVQISNDTTAVLITTEAPTTAQDEVFQVNVTVGSSAVLPCRMDTNSDKYKVIWTVGSGIQPITINGFTYSSDHRISVMRPSEKDWNLVIQNVKLIDSGTYNCRLTSETLIQKIVELNVQGKEEIPVPEDQSFDTIVVPVGSTLRLYCNTTEDFPVWFYEGSKLLLNSPAWRNKAGWSIATHGSLTVSELSINQVEMLDSGTYVCRSSNLAVHGYKVHVTSAPSTTTMPVTSVVHVYATSGETANLPCSMDTNNGNRKVVWTDKWSTLLTLDERRITDDPRFRILRPYFNTWQLAISNVKVEDSGNYTCQMNTVPVTAKYVALTVEEPITMPKKFTTLPREVTTQPIVDTTKTTAVTTTPSVVTTVPTAVTETPILIEHLETNVTARIGGSIVLQCAVDTEGGNYKVLWYKQPPASGIPVFKPVSNTTVLRIDPVEPEHSGTYACLTNTSKSISKRVFLTVEVPSLLEIQQIGPRNAMMRLKSSAEYNKTTIHTVYVYEGLDEKEPAFEAKLSGGIGIINDLDPSIEYKFLLKYPWMTGSIRQDLFVLHSLEFSLQPRASIALVLNDAIGEVYEARGPLKKTKGDEPKFITIGKNNDNIVLNLSSFHRVKVSSYKKTPCPKKKCGMLKLFSYKLNGAMKHQTSLMFADDMKISKCLDPEETPQLQQ